MNIAIVAATLPELTELRKVNFEPHHVDFVIHGIGMLPAAFHIQQIAAKNPELIVQCGIAGSYSRTLEIGETVIVDNEMTDHGAEQEDCLLSVFDLELTDVNEFPFVNGLLPCRFLKQNHFEYQKVNGLTVSSTSGNPVTIEKRINKFNADIETMEGAALHYTCLMMNIPFIQIRTISNFVEKRNKSNWDIGLALSNNAAAVKKILENL